MGTPPVENPSPVSQLSPVPELSPTAASPDHVEAQLVSLAVIGDYGYAGEPLARVAALIKSWAPDYILTAGDNNYPDGEAETIDHNIGQYFHEFIGNYAGEYGPGSPENRFFPALGNHDLNTALGQPYFDYFTLPGNERYYDILLGPVHVFVLNSDTREPDGVAISSTQAAWLQSQLGASTAPWKLVIAHHPPYSSGIHGSVDYLNWPFAEWGASAVISGHDHTYERLEVDGIPYFVNGLGGGPRYEFVEILPESVVRFRQDYGAMLIEAEPARMVFRFITVDGTEVDRFTLGLPQATSAETPSPASTLAVSPSPLPDEVAHNAETLPSPDAFQWRVYASGLDNPVGLIPSVDQTRVLYALEQAGVIRVIENGQVLAEPFLDIRDRVGLNASEQGLLGLAFHPGFADNHLFYVNYTDQEGNTVISRFQAEADASGSWRADPDSEQQLLYILQPYGNHNGGHILFGPDGYLYIGMGDGGSAGDPQGNAQNPQTLLGKLLRIDVNGGQPYAIPPGNPFAGNGSGLPEIYATGLRNPWKFAFDPATDELYLADVGQNQWEEINVLGFEALDGANFGWDYFEGPAAFESSPPPGLELVEPVAWYDHSQGCSVSGGVVYRSSQLPEFSGVYLYADFCSGQVWGLLKDAQGSFQNALLFRLDGFPVGFAQDLNGDYFLVDKAGVIYRLERR